MFEPLSILTRDFQKFQQYLQNEQTYSIYIYSYSIMYLFKNAFDKIEQNR